jgi:MinD-like ATPase involved in chromosome partitioning or flagellar assembly
LFKLPETDDMNDDESNPRGMARKFQIPYLGQLPMDPNMMRSCEEGKCFLEYFPQSTAAKAFGEIVQKLIAATAENN